MINGISSGITGLLLLLAPRMIATLFSVPSQIPFIGVGAFLVIFSLAVVGTAMRKPISQPAVSFISLLDLLWVGSSVLVIIAFSSTLSTIGTIIILGVAVWVGLMAYLQKKLRPERLANWV